jgi:hypothetical protein
MLGVRSLDRSGLATGRFKCRHTHFRRRVEDSDEDGGGDEEAH